MRPEEPGDADIIFEVTRKAFEGKAYSDGTEASLVGRLRQAGVLTLSLVAEERGEVIGHIGFSPVTLNGRETNWFGLGPLSVTPERQLQGVGSALVKTGLEALKGLGAAGCVLVGDPKYYSRFGFQGASSIFNPAFAAPYLQVLHLEGKMPQGEVAFHPEFGE